MQIQNKAPYLFRPSQILRRIRRAWNQAPACPVDVVLPWGLKMTVDPGETIGRTIWNSGIHDLPVCEVLYRLAGPGETAVDAGANIGLMTGLLAGRLGAGGRVYSFEAHPAVYEKLCRHAALWKAQPIAEIVASPRALSSSPGTVTLIPGTDFHPLPRPSFMQLTVTSGFLYPLRAGLEGAVASETGSAEFYKFGGVQWLKLAAVVHKEREQQLCAHRFSRARPTVVPLTVPSHGEVWKL